MAELTIQKGQDIPDNKYLKAIADTQVCTDDAQVAAAVQKIIDDHYQENCTNEVYEFLLNCVDLTTLSTTDSEHSVAEFTKRVNDYWVKYPDYKNVAAICVYSNFAAVVQANLEVSDVGIAVCSACFPSSQAHLESKIAETALAVNDGADEVDIVINMGYFIDGAYEEMCDEIAELKAAVGERHLKVILETGCLKTAENIKKASIIAMYAGADYIKTSTGKLEPAATPEAAYVMCQAIKEYYEETGIQIGFKPAGGINSVMDALIYYTIVKEVLGEKWLTNQWLRLGTSRLANMLLSEIIGEETKFF